MKKTLNINIGNSIIHLEEDAFELLTNYLMEVKQHFGKSADDFEIVNDIENRIAEMFTEMLQTQQKQVIEQEDVRVVIALMGSVKDFEEQSEEEQPAEKSNAGYKQPYAQSSVFAEKSIYRDTDEAMVAGVCSGLSHYLKIDVSILRVAAVLAVLLGGSGFLAYLILWIVIPKAVSRAEKMAMKGEAFNLQGFKKSFEDDQFQPGGKRSGSFITEFIEVLEGFVKGTGRRLFKIIAIVITIVGSLMILASLISIVAVLGFWNSVTNQIFPLNIVDVSYFTTFALALFIAVVIPLLALILFSVRIAFNTGGVNKIVSYGLLLIWLAGISTVIFYTARISTEFKEEARFTKTLAVKNYPVYTLALDHSKFFSKSDSLRYQLNAADYEGKIIQNEDDVFFETPENVKIRIEKSENNLPSLTESYSARGADFETALSQAKNIRYDFAATDSLLKFNPEIHLKKNANWRDQRVELVFRVPVGAKINIDKKLDRYLENYSLWDCEDDDDSDAPYKGIMTADGLKCQQE